MAELRHEYAKIIAKAWTDPEFAKRLRENPVEVLRSEGIENVPERIKVIDLSTEADLAGHDYLIVPPMPASLEKDILDLTLKRITKEFDGCIPCACICGGKP